jgi:hypothetical protein
METYQTMTERQCLARHMKKSAHANLKRDGEYFFLANNTLAPK